MSGLWQTRETRGYMTFTDDNGEIVREAGWYILDWHGNVTARKIRGRNRWIYCRACEIGSYLTFTPDPNAR